MAESPVNFECRLTQLIQLQDASGNLIDSWLVLGEAVAIHIDESLLEEGIYQTAKAEPILRAGGPSAYYGISEAQRFDLVRPDARRRSSSPHKRIGPVRFNLSYRAGDVGCQPAILLPAINNLPQMLPGAPRACCQL